MPVTETDISADLWKISGKIRGLGEILSMGTGEPPLSTEGLLGLSNLLLEWADGLDKLRNAIEGGDIDVLENR